MGRRNLKRLAPPLPEELRQQLANSLAQYLSDEAPEVFKGRKTLPLVSIRPPAHGRISRLGVEAISECSRKRELTTPTPGALRRLKSKVAGYMVFEPVLQYDETVPELYELKWDRGNTEARIDLLPALQPLNMEVPKGHVTEIQLTLEDLGGNYYILLHVQHAVTREIQERELEAQPDEPSQIAAARQERQEE